MWFIYSLLGDIMLSEIKAAIKIMFEHSENVLSVWNVFIEQKRNDQNVPLPKCERGDVPLGALSGGTVIFLYRILLKLS